MPYGYGSRGNKSTNRERGADRNRTQRTSRNKGITASKTSSKSIPDRNRGSSNTTTVATGNQIRASKAKVTAAVGKSRLDNFKVKDIPFAPGISGFTRDLRQKQFERNRKFFREKVLTSKNRGGYVDTLDSYSSYMKNRLSNKTDAYGNKLNLNTGREVEKDPNTPESREAVGRANARAGYGPAVKIYGADGNRYVEGALNIGIEKPGSKSKATVNNSLFKKSGNRSGMIGRSVNNRKISAYRRFLLNEED
jgi:hypothetical protein